MVAMKALPRIHICRLDERHAESLAHEAHRSLNGSGGCRVDDMTTSCFAAETCPSNAPGLTLESMLHNLSFVAIATRESGSYRGIDGPRFVGCVSASYTGPGTAATGHRFLDAERRFLVSNLCVDAAYRGNSLGERLLERICLEHSGEVCLRIARSRHADTDGLFADRVGKLLKFYGRLGFEKEDEIPSSILMVRRGRPPD